MAHFKTATGVKIPAMLLCERNNSLITKRQIMYYEIKMNFINLVVLQILNILIDERFRLANTWNIYVFCKCLRVTE